ncbi:MAG: UDP-3-O-(3-hydroxymyristoyl)glucosamine N-acyltransferase, partial [Desulfobulbaceae bacterium]|nr:UDP-3-O-(3-hydroxymyristoyl)glucosamine N-acyltransferase [Desulfobulbaceae bacterium]
MVQKNETLAELARMVDGEVAGDPKTVIHGLGDIDGAEAGEITFVTKAARMDLLADCLASAVIVPQDAEHIDRPAIKVRDPYLAAAVIQQFFLAEPFVPTGIHPAAHVGDNCVLSDQISVGPMAVVGNRVTIGERVVLHPGVVVGDDVVIGDDTVLHANVSIRAGCRIGSRVIIHDGTVVGSDGFGYATDSRGNHVKRPHVGTVRIDDDVEIGANVCIDRGTFGTTWVKQGVKVDNLVQIAHNVVVGENSILVAQVGIAGSSELGRNVVVGGQAAISGHLKLGDRVMVAGKSGVHNSQEGGVVVAGIPAISHRIWLRSSAAFAKLPELLKRVRNLEKKLAE